MERKVEHRNREAKLLMLARQSTAPPGLHPPASSSPHLPCRRCRAHRHPPPLCRPCSCRCDASSNTAAPTPPPLRPQARAPNRPPPHGHHRWSKHRCRHHRHRKVVWQDGEAEGEAHKGVGASRATNVRARARTNLSSTPIGTVERSLLGYKGSSCGWMSSAGCPGSDSASCREFPRRSSIYGFTTLRVRAPLRSVLACSQGPRRWAGIQLSATTSTTPIRFEVKPMTGLTSVGGCYYSCCPPGLPLLGKDLGAKGVVVKLIKNKIIKAVAPSGKGRAPDAIANVNASERETRLATGADGAETGTLHLFGIISLNCLLKKRRMAW